MTIRRQYSLPNCTLILEGLSDSVTTAGNQPDARPLMTILVNAECYLAGREQPLSGGREFLESLVRSVSSYAQEFLSQVRHPQTHGEKPTLVQLQNIEKNNLHRLMLMENPETAANGYSTTTTSSGIAQEKAVYVDLTTVQLFDLVEATDQFLADSRTLPDLIVPLQPVSRRYKKAEQSAAKRATPAIVGVTSLALAAVALFFVPIPKVREPLPESRTNSSKVTSENSQEEENSTATPESDPPSASETRRTLTEVSEINDPTELGFLKRALYKKLNQSWENRRSLTENLTYQVSVGKDGAVIGYKPVKGTPLNVGEQTPLPELLYIRTPGNNAIQEATAQFLVVFTNTGILQISPWQGYIGQAGLGPEITESAVISNLADQLYQTINTDWDKTLTSPSELAYRVGVTEDGVIADYEPINTPAWDYVEQTPLERLLKPEAAGIGVEGAGLVPQKPLAQFRVVFQPDGVLEVAPYR
ncbi:DUF4335 domain-containing protein [Lyngbya aestuarii]|uniref:DUF4335 domain-containing protein n=1 Tax=Lyngbya aestuarii TaxID=118322 RepID=UPI00403E0BFD